ncbi:hypothetical protein EB1_17350 [Empedobacter brevis NBRC 14943 = ATCC 43319]|uniref:Pyrrolo-quinoline quinone repeat domain-containing protein n=1 Tax=Empedobacter brevis NBRC 14943 = ATCC 43319 TaxID=1218108 RepID=A0A511NGK6_9FLAO|nr:PQQ-binding-like beta-propeller repeat protein [Empedobacter brevis]GEM51945.1 hypothetical protein EB1_17350 [Empedobacter brevis NBRC 14943 = ATCC 43319]
MDRDWRDFKILKGGIEGARSSFEKACESLVRNMHINKNVQSVKVKLGDGGIDIYVGELGLEPIVVYQCKFFLEEFGDAQKAQIRSSFLTAIKSSNYELKNWILCIPNTLDLSETSWWSKWKAKQIYIYKKNSQFISLINGNELIDLMKSYNIYDTIFEIEQRNLTREIHKYVTQFVESFNPIKNGLPIIKWSTYIGKQKRKNTPLVLGNYIYVGSAGNHWNKSDDNDGIYCLDINSGEIVWFFKTNSDVNEISYFDGLIVGGCDDGSVYCLSSKSGKYKWKQSFTSSVMSKIYKFVDYEEESLIICCYDGSIVLVNINNGDILSFNKIEGHIMSDVILEKIDHQYILYIPTIEGIFYELSISHNMISVIHSIQINYPKTINQEPVFISGLYSSPLIIEGKIYLGFVRETYYDYPAIICLDQRTKDIIWYANDVNKLGENFGNIRTNLIFDGKHIVFTHPYSNEIIGLNPQNGHVEWITPIGRNMFQQWASPIQSESSYYLSRHDGYLYKIDKITKKRKWGMYLGDEEDSGVVFDSNQSLSNENETRAWELFKGYSLISTPTISNDMIIVGSDQGIIYCIEKI